MASVSSSLLPRVHSSRANPLHHATNVASVARVAPPAAESKSSTAAVLGRRPLLFLVAPAVAAATATKTAFAVDIPLFGIRKRIEKVEEEVAKEAVELVKEGELVVEKGLETAEKGIETGESILAEGGLVQAGVVFGAEVIGVVIASSVVNGILGPEAQKP